MLINKNSSKSKYIQVAVAELIKLLMVDLVVQVW